MPGGTVSAIARYPVKSMQGESLQAVTLGFHGVPLDRGFAFVQDGVVSPFPWFTGRDCPRLLQCVPQVVPTGSYWPRVDVTVPGGAVLPVESAELAQLLELWSGKKVRLHSDYRGSQDVAYLSVISTATVRAIAAAAGVRPDHRRFRMNLVLDIGEMPFVEKGWVGRTIRVGAAMLAVHEQDQRCQMVTLDPETGESCPAVLKELGKLNGACAGAYCSVLVPGEVRLGDPVELPR